jgi:predicted dehydrogenase
LGGIYGRIFRVEYIWRALFMENGKMGVGIVGLGGFGLFLMREWSLLDDVQIVALSDDDPARNPTNETSAQGARFYTSYEEMLKDPRVDIVSIATPPSTHLPMSLAAIEQGKHVLIEKPVALTAADGRRIAEAASKAGVVATVNFVLRYNPLVEGIRKVVEAGVFGKPRRIDLRNYATQETVPPGHWFWDRSISGGIMIEHGVHFFDMTSYILNKKAREAQGISVWRNEEQEDRVFASVRFEDDVIGTYWHSFTRPKPIETTTFHIDLDLGEIDIFGWIPLVASFWGWTDEKGIEALREYLPGAEIDITQKEPFTTQSCDKVYRVTADISGKSQVQQPKLEVYGSLVRAVLQDIVLAAKDPNHKLRVTLEDAINAVVIAEQATAPLPG